MLNKIITENQITISNDLFRVEYLKSNPDYFTIHYHTFSQEYYIPSCCDSLEKKDLNGEQLSFELKTEDSKCQFVFQYKSTIWEKTYFLDIYEDRAEYYYDLVGNNTIDTLRFFEGTKEEGFSEDFYLIKHFNDKLTTPYREYSIGSKPSFETIFNPEANNYNKQYFETYEHSQVSVNCDLDYCGGNFLANPGTFCFLISKNVSEWITLGLITETGKHHFSEFEYIGGKVFGLNLNYWGLYEVNGTFRTPKIVMHSSSDEISSLEKYTKQARLGYGIKESDSVNPEWWYGPIICGWGHQCYMGDLFRTRSPKERQRDVAVYYMCTQGNYEKFIEMIDSHGLEWKTLTIDIRWFLNDGLKLLDEGRWPDLRGFVDKLHKRGKKVLIWWGPWNPEGLESEDCLTYSQEACKGKSNRPGRFAKFGGMVEGAKVAPDITLESVQNKLRTAINKIFGNGEGCYDIDGVKVDHVASTPAIYGLKFPEGSKKLYGVEILKFYHDFLHNEIRSLRPDALIIGQSPNPYFSESFDMLRLGDIYSHTNKSVNEEMIFRVKMAKAANPNWLIDMDGWPLPSLYAFENYMTAQGKYGVPSLYYASHLDTTNEKIGADVFAKIKDHWTEYLNNRDEIKNK